MESILSFKQLRHVFWIEEDFSSSLPDLCWCGVKKEDFPDFRFHEVYEPGHHYVIFSLSTFESRIIALQSYSYAGEIIVLTSPKDEHELILWPLKEIVAIEFMSRDMVGELIGTWLSKHDLSSGQSGLRANEFSKDFMVFEFLGSDSK